MKKYKGILIVLEGTDAAGKGTQVKLINQYLSEKGLKCEHIHFPMYGHNEASEVIASFLRGEFGGINDVDPFFVANIYAMDRFLYLSELKKKLEENDVVILDRYVFSNMAFQAAKFNGNDDKVDFMIKWIEDLEFEFLKLPYPDLTIFFDVPIKEVKSRLNKERVGEDREYLKGKQDIHEQDIEFQVNVRNIYIRLKEIEEYENYEIVECEVDGQILSPEDLFNTYIDIIENKIQ